MLEIDSTIMTPAPVFETSGHVARFADWMVKDTKTGDVLRADHLVKGVLEARLAGDKEARSLVAQPPKEDEKKKKKKAVKATAVQLPDDAVKKYEVILAQVRSPPFLSIPSWSRGHVASVQLDNYSGPELGELCRKHDIRNPDTDNPVTEPQQFNLMFASSIGPTGQHPG
jgi:glycyl-tRNA synthetase